MKPYRFSKTIFTEANDSFVKMLREARLKAGLTQVQIAKALGCRQTFISKIECSERRVDIVEFVMLCHAYQIDPSEFLKKLSKKTSSEINRI